MAQTSSQKRTVIGVTLVLLLVCELASLAVLFSRMRVFSAETDFGDMIPLTKPDSKTSVTIRKDSAASPSAEEMIPVQDGEAAFIAYDENTVWAAETEVEIFRLTYDEKGDVTVRNNSGSNDALIAPGTSNEYIFTLENTGDVPLDYIMTMEAWVGGTELWLPVKASVRDYNERYLLGSPTQSEDVLELNTVRDDGVLGSGRAALYTLEWEWPFEWGDDAYDTMLGNLAVDTDLTLTIKINTMAMYDANPDDPEVSQSGLVSPQTGDHMPLGVLVIIISAALLIAITAFLAGCRQKEDEDAQTEE